MSLLKLALKNIDIEQKLKDINIKLNEKFNTNVGILIFDSRVVLVDISSIENIEILEQININELLEKS